MFKKLTISSNDVMQSLTIDAFIKSVIAVSADVNINKELIESFSLNLDELKRQMFKEIAENVGNICKRFAFLPDHVVEKDGQECHWLMCESEAMEAVFRNVHYELVNRKSNHQCESYRKLDDLKSWVKNVLPSKSRSINKTLNEYFRDGFFMSRDPISFDEALERFRPTIFESDDSYRLRLTRTYVACLYNKHEKNDPFWRSYSLVSEMVNGQLWPERYERLEASLKAILGKDYNENRNLPFNLANALVHVPPNRCPNLVQEWLNNPDSALFRQALDRRHFSLKEAMAEIKPDPNAIFF